MTADISSLPADWTDFFPSFCKSLVPLNAAKYKPSLIAFQYVFFLFLPPSFSHRVLLKKGWIRVLVYSMQCPPCNVPHTAPRHSQAVAPTLPIPQFVAPLAQLGCPHIFTSFLYLHSKAYNLIHGFSAVPALSEAFTYWRHTRSTRTASSSRGR